LYTYISVHLISCYNFKKFIFKSKLEAFKQH
jgi:hypothetical protein